MCIVRTQYLAHLESMKLQVTAAIIIQRRVRTWLEKRHQERVETAAIRIQVDYNVITTHIPHPKAVVQYSRPDGVEFFTKLA